jgi:hypothetical protein
MLKKCVWCNETEELVFFKDEAHTIPKSLGGKNICINVCDSCNHYYGEIHNKLPSIEETLKEVLYLSRITLIDRNKIGKNKLIPRMKSTYFNIDIEKRKFSLKTKFSLKREFQEVLCRQFKRGIYKIFIEELELNKRDGLNPKYNFIKKFSRYNEGDLPVFYFKRRIPIIVSKVDWIDNPSINFDYKTMNYLIQNDVFFEFELLGQVFGIVVRDDWDNNYLSYLENNKVIKKGFFTSINPITKVTDIDYELSDYID